MKNKILRITKTDIKNAGPYMDNNNCLACTAVRRTFKLPADALVRASGYEVGFKLSGKRPKTFVFCDDGASKISTAYHNGVVKTKPFRITLRPIPLAKFGMGGWDSV